MTSAPGARAAFQMAGGPAPPSPNSQPCSHSAPPQLLHCVPSPRPPAVKSFMHHRVYFLCDSL
jgi:hypothetical protein